MVSIVPSPRQLPSTLFELIAANASSGIIIIDENSRILFLNPAAGTLFGYTPEELTGSPLTDLMPEELRDSHRNGLGRYLLTGEHNMPWSGVELSGLHRSGRLVPLEISFVEVREGQDRFFAGFLRDLTEPRWIQARLAAQFAVSEILSNADDELCALKDVLSAVGENLKFAMGALWIVDGDCLRWQAGWRGGAADAEPFIIASKSRTFARGEGLPGRVWSTATPAWISALQTDSNFPRAEAALASHLHSGLAFPVLCGKEIIGVMEYFSMHMRPLESTLLQILQAIAQQMQQFLERMHAQRTLKETEEQYRMVFANANDAFGVSVDEHFVYVNQAFASMFGYDDPAQLAGVSIYENLPPAQRPVVRLHRQRRLAGLPEPMRYHSRGRKQDGTDFFSEVRATDYWINGRMYTLAILRDITVERQAQETLTQSNAALRRANADLEQFAYAASHDLQEPLRLIMLYSELLHRRHDQGLSDDARQLLATVTDAARRINELVRDLLSYTRTASLDVVTIIPVSANEVLKDVLGTLEDHIASAHAVVTSDNLPMVRMHRTHLVQLFQNLLSNSLKYSKPGHVPHLHVTARQGDSTVELLVQDDGIGIPAEYRERIFGVFKRLHPQRVPGTGIGLAICKKIAEYYGGTIWVSDTEGGGSTFHFAVPVKVKPAEETSS
jgi:PAS domain S-box-containing protein